MSATSATDSAAADSTVAVARLAAFVAWSVEQDEADALIGEPVEPWDLELRGDSDLGQQSVPGQHGSSLASGSDLFSAELAGLAAAVPDLGRLDGVEVAALSAAARIDYLVALERLIARAAAAQNRVLAVIEATDPTVDGFAQEAVACAVRLSGRAAQNRLKTARALADDLPATLGLLEGGALSPAHAQAVVHASYTLRTRVQRHELERRVLPRALEQTVPELARSLRRAVLSIDPATAQTRHDRAKEERRVEQSPLPDGMAELRHIAPAADIADAYQRLDAARRRLPTSDERTADQQRSDLLTDAILAGLPRDGLPTEQGHHPTIHVVVDLLTLLGLNDQPGDLSGYGGITADVARAMAADETGTWHRLITDSITGGLLDYGRTTYRPPANLRDFIIMRDGVCSHPGCTRPAYRCDLEHCQPHGTGPGQGGTTSPTNTAPCCRRHHRCKTFTRWNYAINPDGSFTWTAPTGHTYTSRPPQRWTTPDRNEQDTDRPEPRPDRHRPERHRPDQYRPEPLPKPEADRDEPPF